MSNLVVVVPYFRGARDLPVLLNSLPRDLPVVVVDDLSPDKLPDLSPWPRVKAVRVREKGYFAGAVNRGLEEVDRGDDVLILNQDVWFRNANWLPVLRKQFETAGVVGDFVRPNKCHLVGYVRGTFMAIRADVRARLGPLNAHEYPHWGVTCLYQLRACRAGFKAAPLKGLHKFMVHTTDVPRPSRYGAATRRLLAESTLETQRRLIVTPPVMTVVVPCFNKAPYIGEALQSLMDSTFQDFEIVVVDDGSTDGSRAEIEKWVDPWRYIRAIYLPENQGVPAARNAGVNAAFGRVIFQLDGDDRVTPDGLERMVRAFAKLGGKRWIYTDLALFGDRKNWQVFDDFDDPHPYAIAVRNVAPSCIVYPKAWWEEVGGYHPDTRRGHDDWGFGIQLTLAGHCGARLQSTDGDPRPAVMYRKTKGSRNATSRKRHLELQQTRQRLWPAIFKGYRERKDVVACCGGKTKKHKASPPITPLHVGADRGPAVTVVYKGPARASFPLKGAATGTRYTVRRGEPFQVFKADLRGILRIRGFIAYAPPPVPKAPPAPVVPITEIAGNTEEAMGIPVDGDAGIDDRHEGESAPDPGTLSVNEALRLASNMDLRTLSAFRAQEQTGKNRKSLLTVVEHLMRSLEAKVTGV